MKSNIKIFMAMVVLLCGIGLTACDKNTPNLEQAKLDTLSREGYTLEEIRRSLINN